MRLLNAIPTPTPPVRTAPHQVVFEAVAEVLAVDHVVGGNGNVEGAGRAQNLRRVQVMKVSGMTTGSMAMAHETIESAQTKRTGIPRRAGTG